MKSRILLMAVMCCMTALSAMAQENKRQLVILHTNDTHSTVMPLSENLNDTMKAGRGGFLRRIAMVKEERTKDPDLLLFDSGDFSQGSPYYTLYKGDVEVRLMNLMDYDAVTIGNHEFDFGLENMARIFRMAEFPIVCANYDFTGTPVEGTVRPYVVLERKGLRIGVFGLSPRLDGLVSKENYRGVTFIDPIEKAREVAGLLRNDERCDVVVCLSHLGWLQAKPEVDDSTLIAATRDIDIVLGGHSHTYLKELEWVNNADGTPVPVDQNGKHGIFVGRIVLNCEK
ncbi:MAG: metallophosphatase [Prevotella sp.]|nr:metallophosphatase [Prevotella sp.]MDE6355547.1 metallophosphatase [Prevotella sp.]